jgi:hypothetical protein
VSGHGEVERRVDELAAAHSGRAFADAVRAYAEELDDESREQLEQVLLERGASLDQAVMDRVDARGWLRRQWDKAPQPPPRRR